jgi:hypothetical protein
MEQRQQKPTVMCLAKSMLSECYATLELIISPGRADRAVELLLKIGPILLKARSTRYWKSAIFSALIVD